MIRKKGFTLTELLAVIAILSLLVGLATVTILNVRDNVLEQSYENVVNLLETEAANYAEDTGIMTVTVADLIAEGYVLPDDETDIYNPVNNESLNCHLISSVFENGEYVSTFGEDIGKTDGTCNTYEREMDLVICRYNKDHTSCDTFEDEWLNENVTLGVKYRTGDLIKSPDYTYAWQSSDGSYSAEYFITTNTNMIFQGNYSARVTFSPNEISEANKEIKIDLQSPVVVNAILDESETVSGWAQKKYATITGSDFSGSGVAGIFAGKADTCTPDLTYQEVNANNQVKILLAEDENLVCVKDNAGNVSNSDYVIDNNLVDGSAADDISLTPSTTNYAQSLTLTGSAYDSKSGLVAYQFTTNNSYNDNNWTNITLTNDEIRQTYNVTSNGTYYFWVKDAVGNTESASYTVTNIDRAIDSVGAKNNTTTYETSVSLTGTAVDNLSGITAYAWTTSASAPSSGWTNVSNRSTLSVNNTVSSNGTYYFWVRDAVGNTRSASVSVSNVVRRYEVTVPLYSETDDWIDSSYRANGTVRRLESVTVNNGSVYSSSFSGNTVYFSVRNGTTYRATGQTTCTESPYTYRADYDTYCSDYYCRYGGRVRGDQCVADRGQTYTLQGDSFRVTCKCSNGRYSCNGAGWTNCDEGYYRPDNSSFGCTYTHDYRNDTCTGSGTVYDTGRCKATCYWEGDYDASCSGYEKEYYCDSRYDVLKGSTCYSCDRGSLNSSGTRCSYTCSYSYSYWQYTVRIVYYAA